MVYGVANDENDSRSRYFLFLQPEKKEKTPPRLIRPWQLVAQTAMGFENLVKTMISFIGNFETFFFRPQQAHNFMARKRSGFKLIRTQTQTQTQTHLLQQLNRKGNAAQRTQVP
jgi:hypothetical protein